MIRAMVLTIRVFAVPGAPSRSACPSAKRQIKIWSMTASWPKMILRFTADVRGDLADILSHAI